MKALKTSSIVFMEGSINKPENGQTTFPKVSKIITDKPIRIILSQSFRKPIFLLKMFGYFPYSSNQNGFIDFNAKSFLTIYSISLILLYIAFFFIFSIKFQKLFSFVEISINKLDFIVYS